MSGVHVQPEDWPVGRGISRGALVILLILGWAVLFRPAASAQPEGERAQYEKLQKLIDAQAIRSRALRDVERDFRLMLNKNPRSAYALTGLGRLAYKTGRLNRDRNEARALDEAVRQLKQAAELDPKLFDAWYYLALAHLARHKIEEARQAADRAKAIAPDDYRSEHLLAEVALGEKKYDEAAAHGRSALDKTKDKKIQAEIYGLLSRVHRLRNDLDAAEEAYRKVLEIKPDAWGEVNYASFLLEARKDFDGAIDHARKSLKHGDFWTGRRVLAQAALAKADDLLWRRKKPVEAEPLFRLAIEKNPRLYEAHFGLGVCRYLEGERRKDPKTLLEAQGHLILAIRLNPGLTKAREQLVQTEMKLRELSR